MAFTKITGPGIHTLSNIMSHNVKSSGIITAVNGNLTGWLAVGSTASFGGDVSIGGTLTYDDVTNVEAVGIITAKAGIHVGAGGTIIHAVSSNDGKVGIGTDTPQTILHLHDTSSPRIQITDASTGAASGDGVIAGINGEDDFFINNRKSGKGIKFFTGTNDERMVINSEGDVGIHTDPARRLSIFDTAACVLELNSTNSGGTSLRIQNNHVDKMLLGLAGDFIVGQGSNVTDSAIRNEGDLIISTGGGNEKFRITSGGSVLIDTTVTTEASADGNDLIIGSTSDTQKGISIVGSTTNGVGNIFFTDGASYKNQGIIQYRHADDSMRFTTGQYEALRIKSDGNVGIGTTNPQVKLTVSSTSPAVCDIHHKDGGTDDEARIILGALANNPPSNRGAGIAAVNNGAGHDLIIKCSASHATGPTERLRIKSNGELRVPAGIGAQLRFENQHSVTTDAAISTFDDATGTLLCLGSNFYFNSAGSETRYDTGEESAGIVINRNGIINFNTGGTGATATTRLRITSTGAIQNYYNTNLPVTDSRPILQLGYGVIGDDSAGRNNVSTNAYPVSGDSSWHYIGSGSLKAARYDCGFGEHKWYTAVAGTRGNDITWSERLRIDSDGRVGINSTSPLNTLVVRESTDNNSSLQLFRESTGGDIASVIWATNSGNQAQINYRGGGGSEGLQFYTGGTGSSNMRLRITTDGNIYHTSDGGRIFSTRNFGEAGILIGSGNAGGATIYLDGDSNGDWSGGDYAYIRHNVSGNLDIVSTNPNDDGQITFNTGAGTYVGLITSDGVLKMSGASNDRAIEINPGGNAGTMVLDRGGYLTSMIRASDGGSNVAGSSGGGSRLQLAKKQIYMYTFNHTTNIGDPPSYSQVFRIDTSGNFHGSSSNNISDQRLKKDIETVTDPLTKIKGLTGRTFKWKEDSTKFDDKTKYGFIAQEVETTIPELVDTEHGIILFDKDDKVIYDEDAAVSRSKAVNETGVIPITVEALKVLISKVETLEAKVAALEGS